MKMSSDSSFSFQNKRQQQFNLPVLRHKKPRKNTIKKAVLHIKILGLPLISRYTGQLCESICLEPCKPYTIGRKFKFCDFIINDRRVSKRHCQLFFDSVNNKICLSDGFFLDCSECSDSFSSHRSRVSLNGAFVNGVRIGGVVELQVGDVVSLVCGNEETCGPGSRIGFLVERVIFLEEVDLRSSTELDSCIVHSEHANFRFEHFRAIDNTSVLLSWCRDIVCSDDPVSYIRNYVVLDQNKRIDFAFKNRNKKRFGLLQNDGFGFCLNGRIQVECGNRKRVYSREIEVVEKRDEICRDKIIVDSEENAEFKCTDVVGNANADTVWQTSGFGNHLGHGDFVNDGSVSLSSGKQNFSRCREDSEEKSCRDCMLPPGRKFYLNRLQSRGQDREELDGVVSLPELFHPIKSLIRVFIATFTSDILWFISYCKIPPHLPVTIACHNAERCWSLDPDERTSVPFSDFPNLTVVYPPFPEAIAFNKDRKNSGIACHHPKLMVLQREDSMRVVITSANLVAKQWLNVTNTVWWQDFPRLIIPNCLSLFSRLSAGEINTHSTGDFAAQLAGFVASLIAGVPSQAYWILELTKYDFKEAVGYLVASVPGIHSHRSPPASESKHHMVGKSHKLESSGANLLSSVEASVVGLSCIYRASADSNGSQLKKLASFLRKCDDNMDGMSEIVLRRDTNIPADGNAVSVFVPNPEDFSLEDIVQLGFLPRHVAKWVAPLSDVGLFAFAAYINPKEVLATALEGSNNKVKLILYVYAGPSFCDISDVMLHEYASAICSLVALSQRHSGLWRLKEVLGQNKWPEHLESDFVFGSSSVGSVNAQFLAAFSAASGKRSVPFSESEESDPDWGCWNASLEIKNPSISIIFPTIERVKNNRSGIAASRRMLCFSQKTWLRLKNVGVLHDSIPHPINRVGLPMHVKVGRRRFHSPKDGSSFGWVYCGSHNFSAAAWGRPISDTQSKGTVTKSSVLGSRLHISNYELGIVFIVPPPDAAHTVKQAIRNLDDIVLPFVVPPPKYTSMDRPATAQAMREALTELMEQEQELNEADLGVEEEIPEEEEDEILEIVKCYTQEKEDEKAYADRLWSQVNSSESC